MKKDEKYKISNKYKISVAYSAIKQRCYNPKCKAYKNYGARGIKMCQEWFDNPILFYEWAMKKRNIITLWAKLKMMFGT